MKRAGDDSNELANARAAMAKRWQKETAQETRHTEGTPIATLNTVDKGPAVAATTWECHVCTFVNPLSLRECGVCDSAREDEDVLQSNNTSGWRLQSSGAYVHTRYVALDMDAQPHLTVVSLNVWFEPHWQRWRWLKQKEWFERLAADVICLQEVTPEYLK
jgi:hypothetical protein